MNFKIIAIPVLMLVSCFFTIAAQAKPKGAYFQVTVYHFKTAEQEKLIDGFLKEAFLPELHKAGIASVGVFKPLANDTAFEKLIYVIRAFKNMDKLADVSDKLAGANSYAGGLDYLNSTYKAPPFTRMENIVISAFEMAPQLTLPKLTSPKSNHIYELRSYEGATERVFNSKVKMFNQGGEVTLFERLQFNAVFYGRVIAGSKMPNLMYMTSFENMQERDAHWKTFSADPEWKILSAMPEYQNNVSKNETTLMRATEYSDF